MAFCPSCGSQNPDGSKFCTGCGAKFGSSDANPGFSSVGGQGYDFEIKDKPVFSIIPLCNGRYALPEESRKTYPVCPTGRVRP